MLPQTRLMLQRRQNEFNESYKEFQASLKNHSADALPKTFQVIKDYERLVGDLYRMRAGCGREDSLRVRSEDYVGLISQDLLGFRKVEEKKSGYRHFIANYRRVWRENFSLFLFTAFLFIASCLLGWYVTKINPNNASAFVPDQTLENVLDGHRWFERIQNAPWTHGFQIAYNNIRVSLNCFLLGALLGIGGIYILSYNGLMLGAVFAFCYYNGFHGALTNFVIGHGALELTIIVASAFASFLIGRTFYQRPFRLFKVRMAQAFQDSKYVLLGILPWLVLAAIVEVFVSPWPMFSFEFKLLLSIGITAAFWLWTFWPYSNAHRLAQK